MGLIVMAVAAKMLADQRKRSTYHKTNQKVEKTKYERHDDIQTKLIYSDCVIYEMLNGETKLFDFFNLLKNEYAIDLLAERKKHEKKYSELLSKNNCITPNFDEFTRRMKEKGIEIRHGIIGEYNYYGQIPLIIDGVTFLTLTSNNVKDIINLLREKLKYLENVRDTYKKEVDKVNEKIFNAKKKAKFAIFKRAELKQEIKKFECELNGINKTYEDYVNKAAIVEKVINMDEREKQLLSLGIKELQDLALYKKNIGEERNNIYKYSSVAIENHINKELMETTFYRLIQEGKITKSNIEKIMLILEKIRVKKEKGNYTSKTIRSSKYGSIRNVAEWFINNIYPFYKKSDDKENSKGLIM